MYRKRRIFGRTVAGLVSSILSLALARLWDVQTGDLLATLPHEKLCEYCDAGTGVDVAFSPNGLTIATSTFSRVYLWDAPTKKLKVSLIDERLSRVLRNGDKYVRQTFSHGQTIYEIDFSPDGRTLASRSRDGTTKLWDATTGQLDAILRIGWSVNALAFSPDSRIVATGSFVVMLWSVRTGDLLATLPHKGTVWSIAFSPDGKLVATFADNEHAVKVWDVTTGKLLQILTEARDVVAFSPDGRTLATGGRNGAVLLGGEQR